MSEEHEYDESEGHPELDAQLNAEVRFFSSLGPLSLFMTHYRSGRSASRLESQSRTAFLFEFIMFFSLYFAKPKNGI